MRRLQKGFSLVELMVAVTIAMITAIVVLQVLNTYESRKRTVTIGNDAEINAAVGLYMVEREVRMAGVGFTSPTGLLCANGLNAFFGGATLADGVAVPVANITDGGSQPDRISVLRSDANFGIAPGSIVQLMGSASADVRVDGATGLSNGDLFLAASPDGIKDCTLMQLSEAPEADGNGWLLHHDGNDAGYNPADPAAAFSTPVTYDAGDVVYNLGTFGARMFRVICSDGGNPSLTNVCNLTSYDAIEAPANPTLAQAETLASQVVDFQLQYGVAPANSPTVNEWVDATGTWAAPSAADQRRIKAIRMSIVTRGNLEREMVAPASLVLWDAGEATERSIPLSNDQRMYRYKVLTVVVPLINMIWAGA